MLRVDPYHVENPNWHHTFSTVSRETITYLDAQLLGKNEVIHFIYCVDGAIQNSAVNFVQLPFSYFYQICNFSLWHLHFFLSS